MKSITIQKVNKGYIVNPWRGRSECSEGEPYVYTSIKDLQDDLPELLKDESEAPRCQS